MTVQRIAASLLCGLVATSILIAALATQSAAQPSDAGAAAVRAALMKWTEDFNNGKGQEVCGLFSPDLRYDYRGQPERNYKDICDLLHSSLSDRTKRYAYSLAIKEILVSGDLAVVRLIWTLNITKPDVQTAATSQEYGIDVFRRQPDGAWKIIRFIAYDTSG